MTFLSRYRIHFGKTEAMRYTSHLDLHRTWERSFRRSQLPLAYSEGFHPQPRLTLACALPLGFTSQAEVIDAWLLGEIELDQLDIKLKPALPPGIEVYNLEEVDLHSPSLQTLLLSVEYLVSLQSKVDDLDSRIQRLLSTSTILRTRRVKSYDLRPLIEMIEISKESQSNTNSSFRTRLAAREGATGRPEELLAEMGLDQYKARIHRLKLIFQD